MRAPGFHATESQGLVLDLEVRRLSGNAAVRVGLQELEHLRRPAGPACNKGGHQAINEGARDNRSALEGRTSDRG